MTTTISPVIATRIAHYRKLAEGDRKAAETYSDPWVKQHYLDSAKRHDGLADALEADARREEA